MDDNRQMEVHYINTGFPFTVTESFMDLFEGLTYPHMDCSPAGALHEQEGTYCSMHTNSYKYGLSGLGSSAYYSYSQAYGITDHLLGAEGDMEAWHNPPMVNNEEPSSLFLHGGQSSNTTTFSSPEDCICNHQSASSSQGLQVIWQDNLDPDNMTYEELLDLGETVGTQNRGLSQERISSLPISKYKCSFFSRKKKQGERCVICQMVYKRGDRLMTLPCKHSYHASCVSRWLGINKACPVCFIEVSGEESRH